VPACLLRQSQGKAIVIYSRCEDEALCRDAGDVRTSSRSGNAADARPAPRPFGLRPPGPPAALLAPYIPRRVGSSLVSCRRAWGPQQSGPVIL